MESGGKDWRAVDHGANTKFFCTLGKNIFLGMSQERIRTLIERSSPVSAVMRSRSKHKNSF
jgi:hypothetical protein